MEVLEPEVSGHRGLLSEAYYHGIGLEVKWPRLGGHVGYWQSSQSFNLLLSTKVLGPRLTLNVVRTYHTLQVVCFYSRDNILLVVFVAYSSIFFSAFSYWCRNISKPHMCYSTKLYLENALEEL